MDRLPHASPDRHNVTALHRLIILSDHFRRLSMVRIALVLVFCAGIGLYAQEKISLTVAESIPEYRIANLVLTYDDPATSVDEGAIVLDLKGAGTANATCRYGAGTSPTGTFLINALNKSDLSSAYNNNATTGSLKQRVCHRLVIMGESTAICGKTITGTCTGSVP